MIAEARKTNSSHRQRLTAIQKVKVDQKLTLDLRVALRLILSQKPVPTLDLNLALTLAQNLRVALSPNPSLRPSLRVIVTPT